MLHCNLTVAGQPFPLETEVPFSGSVFDPAIPISLGLTHDNGNPVGLIPQRKVKGVWISTGGRI